MNKDAFLSALRDRLAGLPEKDIKMSLDYYNEIIDDRMEEGLSEEEAVQAVGDLEEIVSQILMDTSLPKLVKAKVKPKRTLKTWEIVLLVLGSPVWLPLLFAAACILLAVYIVLWSVILVLYSVDFSFAAGALAGIVGFFVSLPDGNIAQSALFLGGGVFCGGITILLFIGFNRITQEVLILSKKFLLAIKTRFIRKEKAQ